MPAEQHFACRTMDTDPNSATTTETQEPDRRSFFDRITGIEFTEHKPELIHLANLVKRFNATSGIRFETARRHKKKHRTSTLSIILLSFYAIFFSMLSTFKVGASDVYRDLLGLLSIFMSSFIVALTVYENSKRYDARSELFLRCANSIQELRDRAVILLRMKCLKWEEIQELELEYHRVIDAYTDNHSHLDQDERASLNNRMPAEKANWHRFLYFGNVWTLPLLSLISPVFVFVLYVAFTKVIPSFLGLPANVTGTLHQ